MLKMLRDLVWNRPSWSESSSFRLGAAEKEPGDHGKGDS